MILIRSFLFVFLSLISLYLLPASKPKIACWNSLPKEIYNEITDSILEMQKTIHHKTSEPKAYTVYHNLYATLQMLTLTQKRDAKWSKDMANLIQQKCLQSEDPILMSLCGLKANKIFQFFDHTQQFGSSDNPIRKMRGKALEHLGNVLKKLETPIGQKTLIRFVKSCPQILLTNDPYSLIPDTTFVLQHYSPFMTTLIEKKEYDTLSFLTLHKWPLITGDKVPPDHELLLLKNCKTNPPELRKVRDMLHKVYRYRIYSAGSYYFTGSDSYYVCLHAPESEACSIV